MSATENEMFLFPIADFANRSPTPRRTFDSFASWFTAAWMNANVAVVTRDESLVDRGPSAHGQNRLLPISWSAVWEQTELDSFDRSAVKVIHGGEETDYDDAYHLSRLLTEFETLGFGIRGPYLIDCRSDGLLCLAKWYFEKYHATKDQYTGKGTRLTTYLFLGEQVPLALGHRWAVVDFNSQTYFSAPETSGGVLPRIDARASSSLPSIPTEFVG